MTGAGVGMVSEGHHVSVQAPLGTSQAPDGYSHMGAIRVAQKRFLAYASIRACGHDNGRLVKPEFPRRRLNLPAIAGGAMKNEPNDANRTEVGIRSIPKETDLSEDETGSAPDNEDMK